MTEMFDRFRRVSRDIETDVKRLDPVQSAVDSAVRACALELEGLRRRMESAREKAAFLIDTESPKTLDRDPALESAIRDAEMSLLEGERRVSRLGRQLTILHAVQLQIESLISGRGSADRIAG